MRKTAITCVLALLVTQPVFAQEWTEYKSVGVGFQAQFPGQPRVVETTWKSQAGFSLPARVYSAERGRERYSVTVADYSGIEALGKEKAKTCLAGAETCLGSANLSGVGLLDKNVNEFRYQSLYSHEIHGLRQAPTPPH